MWLANKSCLETWGFAGLGEITPFLRPHGFLDDSIQKSNSRGNIGSASHWKRKVLQNNSLLGILKLFVSGVNFFCKATKWGTVSMTLCSPLQIEPGMCMDSYCSGKVIYSWVCSLIHKEHGNHSPRAWMLCHGIPFMFRVKLICHVLTLLSMLQIKLISKQKPACRISIEAAKVQTDKEASRHSFLLV